MADTTALKNRIRAAIKANDNQEITGPVLQQALLDMVDELNGATETEASQRQNADSTLQQGINTERQQRQDADTALGQRITDEIGQERQRAEDAFNDLDMIDAAGSEVSPNAIDLTLRKNDGSEEDLEWQTLCHLLIPSVTTERAGLMSVAMRNLLYNLRNAGYAFGGIAVTATNPGVPSGNCFYIVRGAGTYANFKNADNESIVLENDGIYVLTYESVENQYWEYNLIVSIDSKPTAGSHSILESSGAAVGLLSGDEQKNINAGEVQTGYYYNSNLELANGAGKYYSPVDVSSYVNHDIIIIIKGVFAQSGRYIGIKDNNGNIVFRIAEADINIVNGNVGCLRFKNIPSQSKYLCISFNANATLLSCVALDSNAELRAEIPALKELTEKNDIILNGSNFNGSKASAGSAKYDYAFIPGIEYTLKNNSSGSINAFTNNGSDDIETIVQSLGAGQSVQFTPNQSADHIRVYFYASKGGSFVLTSASIQESLSSLNDDIDSINNDVSELEGNTKAISITESSGHYYSYKAVGTTVNSESDILTGSDGKYKAVDLSAYAGKILKFRITSSASSSARCTLLVSNNKVLYSKYEADIRNQDIFLDIPENATLYESHAASSTISISVITIGVNEKIEDIQKELAIMKECYVASNGNNDNPGTLQLPFATISHAIELGFRNICVKAGVYNENLNINNMEGLNIYAYDVDSYDGNTRKRPVFTNGEIYNSFQQGSGYKYFNIVDTPQTYIDVFINHTLEPIITFESFQNTYNVGLWAKCANSYNDFMFKPVLTLEGLSENNTFFYDGTNVYFNTDTVIEGVVVVKDSEYVANFMNCNNLHLSGLEFSYGYTNGVNILATNNALVENCSCHHSLRRNNWAYTRSDVIFRNCISYKARRDGFNAAWYGVVVLDNCRSIYNYDDGESSHEYCEIIVIGGEYAHNGKAGHAPVNGCKFSCNGTYSHDNYVNGLLRSGGSGYSVLPYLISNSVFINNGTDIVTDIDINMMNCKYVTKTGEGTIHNLTE